MASIVFASCSPLARLENSATHVKANVANPVTAVVADLDVSPTKISFFYIPSQTVINAGVDNAVNSAVREALLANGDADVLVALEKQIKYSAEGKIESVTVTGYPAKYVNFRSPSNELLLELSKNSSSDTKNSNVGSLPFIGR